MLRLPRRQLLLAIAAAATLPESFAQTKNLDKPVRIIVGYGAGTGLDIVARHVGEALSKQIGQPVIVLNSPGADGNIGAAAAVRASTDMYTLLVSGSSTHAANSAIYGKLHFSPESDFTPLSAFGYIPFVLVINPEQNKSRTLAEFLSAAKATNQSLSFGSPSVGSRIAGELFKQRAQLNATNVPYKQSSEVMTDLLGGRLDFYFCDIATAIPLIAAGKVTPIAVSIKDRVPKLPNVPSLAESGFPDFDVSSWAAMWSASKTTPKLISDQLAKQVSAIVQEEKGRSFLLERGYVPAPAGATHLAELQARDTVVWGNVIRSSGMAQPQR